MISVKEAIETLLEGSCRRVELETISLGDATGRTLADDLVSPIHVPPADNSAMDGYVIRIDDWKGEETSIPLSQRITAGSVPAELEPGTAARIFTGAAVPPGADTVVMQEHCEESGGGVRIRKLPAQGANIRPKSQDVRKGQTVLTAGQRLRPQEIGLAASLGIARVPVYRRLRVAVLSTGDELAEPGETAQPGQIYNSNRYTMNAQLEAWGFEVVDMGVARDDFDTVRAVMDEAAGRADVIVTSGGVSVGEEDHVKAVVESLGAIGLWKIAVKPGKPFAFGNVRGTPFLGLPGNPVSVFVTLLVIARPYLFACQGTADTAVHAVPQKALFNRKSTWREEYIRVRSTAQGVEPYDNQSSGALFSTCWSDGLVRQAKDSEICEGDTVDYLPYAVFG
jgi:molybdopterin molybdotransferase